MAANLVPLAGEPPDEIGMFLRYPADREERPPGAGVVEQPHEHFGIGDDA